MYLHACLPIRVDISGTGAGHRLGRFVGLSVHVGNLGRMVIFGYFRLFLVIYGICTWATSARRRAASILKRYVAGVKKMEVHYCSSKKDLCIFPLTNIYNNIRYLLLEVQVSNASEVVQISFYLFISGETSFEKKIYIAFCIISLSHVFTIRCDQTMSSYCQHSAVPNRGAFFV